MVVAKNWYINFKRRRLCADYRGNTGEVLPAEELPHLFDSFYRGSNAGSQEGSGLGLYICRKLMHKMNGDVFLKQEENLFSVTVVVGMAN